MKFYKFFMAILSFSLWVGCEKAIDELEDTAHQSRPFTEVMTVTVEVKIDNSPMEAAQAVLGEYADTMSDIWKWIDGDVAYAVYDLEGMQDICPSKSIVISEENPSEAQVIFEHIPVGAKIISVQLGGNAVFGQDIPVGEKMSKSMVFMKGEVTSEVGQAHVKDVVLVNQCRYLVLDLADVAFYGIGFETRSLNISGDGLFGGKNLDKITFDYTREKFTDKAILALSKNAESLKISADFVVGEKEILNLTSLEECPTILSICDVPDETELMTVTVDVTLDASAKALCTDYELSEAAADLWTWKHDDKVYASVEIYGYSGKISSDIVKVDENDDNRAQIIFHRIPAESVITAISVGDSNAFGKIASSQSGISRDMMFAEALVQSSVGTARIEGVDLKHNCSYLNIKADKLQIDGQQHEVKGISVTGAGIIEKDVATLIPLFSEPNEGAYWLSVSKEAELLSVVASYGETAALIYTKQKMSGVSEVLKVRADNPEKAVFRTVLYEDGTFIVNQISAYSSLHSVLHGDEVAVYPPLDSDNNYVFLDHNEDYVYLEGEELPENELDMKYTINDLVNVEDVETYFISYYGEAEGRAKLRTPWENEKSMIKSVQFGSTIRPRSMSLWFKGCSSLTDVNVSGLDLSQCESLWATFMDCTSLVNIDVSDWDLSKAWTISQIFNHCSSLESLDVSKWNTGNVRSFSRTFEGCEKIKELNVSDWDVSKAQTIRYVFAECKSLSRIDVADWDVSSVRNFTGTFNFCSALEAIDVSRWNTSSAYTSFFKVFCDCTLLKSLDLSSWNVDNVIKFDNMFSRCSSIKTIDLSGWNIKSMELCPNMFRQCFALETIYADKSFDVTNLFFTATKGMFYQCSSLTGGLGTKIPEGKLQSDLNPECSGRYFGRVDMVGDDGTPLPGLFTLK